MGREIAYVSSIGRFSLLRLYDSNEAALQNAENELEQIFEKGLSRGKISVEKVKNPQSITSIFM